MKPLLILRPEPANGATAERARSLGLRTVQCPLFKVEPVAWQAPDPARFDALLMTSANAARHGGDALGALRQLPVVAVGAATAAAAREAGFGVAVVGTSGVAALLDGLDGVQRLLHLAGEVHHPDASRHCIERVVTYRAVPLDPLLPDGALVALVHSARAGARLARLAPARGAIAIAAISKAAMAACGTGWAALECAPAPDEAALLALAARLCQD